MPDLRPARRGRLAAAGAAALLLPLAVSERAADSRAGAHDGLRPTSYRLDLRYRTRGAGELDGAETIAFENRGAEPQGIAWLRLWANGPGGCRRRRISIQVEAPAAARPLRTRCTALPVRLPSPVAPGRSGELRLRFTVRGRRAAYRFGRSAGAVLLGNVIPVMAVRDARGLHLERYSRNGESFYSLSARWDATLRLPRWLRAATTGAVLSETVAGARRTLTVATQHARDFGLAVGRFRVASGRAGPVRVRVFTARRRGHRRAMLRTALRAMRAYGARFGRYGSPEVELVEITARFVGMEYPELVFSQPYRYVVAHELSHQWWYSMVGNDQYREPWLDESFASYSEHLLAGGFRYCNLRGPFAGLARGWRLDRTMRYFDPRPIAYWATVYDSGACALRSLEHSLGRARMRRLLRLLVSRYRYGVVTKADVLATIEEVVARRFSLGRFLSRARLSPP